MTGAIAGFVNLLIWAYLLLAHGKFWRVQRPAANQRVPAIIQDRIAVIVPARNEAEVVGKSIGALLNQTCIGSLHIFLVDDASADSTAQFARETAASEGKTDNLTVINGQPLPQGWSGGPEH